MPTIFTSRLRLEPLEARHAEEMFAVEGEPGLYRFLDSPPPASLEALRERYRMLATRLSPDGAEHWLNWIVREAASGKAIGYVQATVHADGEAHIAYLIAGGAQGRGYAREATAAMIAELEAANGVKVLHASVDPRNAPSIALLRDLGFRITNEAREGAENRGKTLTGDIDFIRDRRQA